MRYFDSHAHYYDERFTEENEKSVDELIGALLKEEISYIVNVGTDPATCRKAIEQAKKFPKRKQKKFKIAVSMKFSCL